MKMLLIVLLMPTAMDHFRWPNEYVNWNDDLLKQCCPTSKCH